MKLKYIDKNFAESSLLIIAQANQIIDKFQSDGYDLTLRQLYYQFVHRNWVANKQSEYNRIGRIVNDARLAGLISWDAIIDRTRNLKSLAHWESPAEIISSAARQFRLDKWANQDFRPEVWIEKEALSGVVAKICNEYDVPYFACRGYNSQSEAWRAAQRATEHFDNDQVPLIIHLGDHDPSGIDMTRDNQERFEMFYSGAKVVRIALNYDQVEQYDLPPNPAKQTDSRCTGYIEKHGNSSWELDALDPSIISRLIEDTLTPLIDEDRLKETKERQAKYKKALFNFAATWKD